MSIEKNKLLYIISLLILASLLVLFAQGAFVGLSEGDKSVIEINRIDLYDDLVGNYSKVSVQITNNDTVSHNFSINTFHDDEMVKSYNITIKSGMSFTYQTDVLPEKIPISRNETINSTLRVARFVVYVDEESEPFEQVSFVFKK
jgi:hypothetical protein